jgi:hypothetical protein
MIVSKWLSTAGTKMVLTKFTGESEDRPAKIPHGSMKIRPTRIITRMEVFLETGKGTDQRYSGKRTVSIDEMTFSDSGSIIQDLDCTAAVHYTVQSDGRESRLLPQSARLERNYQ